MSHAEEKLNNQHSTYSPKEILANHSVELLDGVIKFAKSRLDVDIQYIEDENFDFDNSTNLILQTMNKDEIDSLGLGRSKAGVCALGAVILYLRENRKTDELETPSQVEYYEESEFMNLDISARRNLELTRSMMTGDKRHSLLWVIDNTKTAMGKRTLRSWLERPLVNVSQITKRQNAVAELVDDNMLRDDIKELLTGINDIERLMSRIAYGTANAKELRSLYATLDNLPSLKERLSGTSSALLRSVYSGINELRDVHDLIVRARG